MKVKLIESVKPISKYERGIEQNIIPALEDLGYKVSLGRTLKEKFINTYFGTYTDYKGMSMPFTLKISTSSPFIDDPYPLFATLSLGGKSIKLGSFSSKDPEDFKDLLDNSLPDAFKYTDKFNSSNQDLITSKNNKYHYTKDEWLTLYKENKKTMDASQFARWWNEVFPDELTSFLN